jgi:hypothetical protein
VGDTDAEVDGEGNKDGLREGEKGGSETKQREPETDERDEVAVEGVEETVAVLSRLAEAGNGRSWRCS